MIGKTKARIKEYEDLININEKCIVIYKTANADIFIKIAESEITTYQNAVKDLEVTLDLIERLNSIIPYKECKHEYVEWIGDDYRCVDCGNKADYSESIQGMNEQAESEKLAKKLELP